MSLSPPEGYGPLRRERLRTARLYFCCEARPGGQDPEALLRAALGGGVDVVQLREKKLGRAEIERAASTFRRVCDTYSALFIVNDDLTPSIPSPGCGPNPPTDTYSVCDYNASKEGGSHDVVVEIEYNFVPFTPLVANALGNSTIMWAKSEMRTEY
jgi:hypothetical protein